MKAKINQYGQLSIERGRVVENWKTAGCPFCPIEDTCCGDWCPHFDTFITSTTAEITMCHGNRIVVPAANFADERP